MSNGSTPTPSTGSSPVAPVAERVSRRRTSARHGFVNFPVDGTEYVSSREGGMFVKLVVVDDRDYDESNWNICCGAVVYDRLGEQLVGDSEAVVPDFEAFVVPNEAASDTRTALDAYTEAVRAWESRHFPGLHDPESDDDSRYLSRPYVASLLLGITGWSGYSDAQDAYWRCTVADLTSEGKALFAQLQALYPGCTLHLLTFLDT